jgi:hypothetical protein
MVVLPVISLAGKADERGPVRPPTRTRAARRRQFPWDFSAPQQPWPAQQQDFLASFAGEPQQLLASAQHAEPERQHAWAPLQQDRACAQQSLPTAQQPSLTGAAQHA